MRLRKDFIGIGIAVLFLFSSDFAQTSTPQTAEEFFKLGKEYQSKKEYNLAAKAFGEAIKLKLDYAEAFFERGRTNQMSAGESPYSGAYRETLIFKPILLDFQQAVYLSPNVANYYYHRGLNYFAAGKFQEAVDDFTKAIALAPDQAEGFRVRFEAYRELKNFDNALKDINKAIELQPKDLRFYFGRGELYLIQTDCQFAEKAITDFSFIINANPSFPIVYEKRAEAYKKLADCSQKLADKYSLMAIADEQEKWKISGIPLNSRARFLAKPIYPKNLIPLKLGGKVTVSITIDGDGNVTRAQMFGGDSRFKESAEAAAMATKFPSTVINSEQIKIQGLLEFEFVLPIIQDSNYLGNGRGNGNGSGDGNWSPASGFFITEKLMVRNYLPGDTKPIEIYKTYILGELDLPTTNPATLFTAEKPLIEPGDTPLELISVPKAVMTEEARKNEVQGTVTLRVTFNANGTIGNISVVSGLLYGLTESAVEAAKNIKFTPAMKKGVPVAAVKTFQFSFSVK
jgi:TonB family protein